MIGLLTGDVGCGKTTVAGQVVSIARGQGMACGGVLSPALLDAAGRKVGIWAVDVWDGQRRLLAHVGRDLGGPRVGPYSFDPAALDWSVSAIERAVLHSDLVVVDEIGKLELWAGAGLAPILPRLAAGEGRKWLVVVRIQLLAELQARLGAAQTTLFQATRENRDSLPAAIAARLGPRA